jgi:DNA-binding response OmpR family regulator
LSATIGARIAHILAAALDREFLGRKHDPAALSDVVHEVLTAAQELIDRGAEPRKQYQFDELIVDPTALRAHWRGRALTLTPTQLRLLAQLLSVPVTPARILAGVLGRTSSNASLRVTVTRLREALPPEIEVEAVYRQGYRVKVDGKLLSDH